MIKKIKNLLKMWSVQMQLLMALGSAIAMVAGNGGDFWTLLAVMLGNFITIVVRALPQEGVEG